MYLANFVSLFALRPEYLEPSRAVVESVDLGLLLDHKTKRAQTFLSAILGTAKARLNRQGANLAQKFTTNSSAVQCEEFTVLADGDDLVLAYENVVYLVGPEKFTLRDGMGDCGSVQLHITGVGASGKLTHMFSPALNVEDGRRLNQFGGAWDRFDAGNEGFDFGDEKHSDEG